MSKAPIIFVWIGQTLPKWSQDSLQLAKKNNPDRKIFLIKNKISNSCEMVDGVFFIEDLVSRKSSIDSARHNDYKLSQFWLATSERFSVLLCFAETYKMSRFFHAELDNVIFNLDGLDPRLDAVGRGMFIPRDSELRGVGSLIYVNNIDSLYQFENERERLNRFEFVNDMQILGSLLKSSEIFYSLPVEISILEVNSKWEPLPVSVCDGLFDAAAIGQFIFGIDPKNTKFPLFNGFVNENSSNRIGYLEFKADLALGSFEVKFNNNNYKLFNIHLHSKKFEIFRDERKLVEIVRKLNGGRKSLIDGKTFIFNWFLPLKSFLGRILK